jgi:sulfate transport system substrate-binding protein
MPFSFARQTHTYLDLDAARDFEREIVVKVNVPELLAAELRRPSWKRELVAFGTNTDPYQWAEGRYELMPPMLEALRETRTPASVLSKSPLPLRDLDQYLRLAEVAEVSVNFSIPTLEQAAWNKNEHDGIITDSVVTLSVRPGNPEGIESFDDLLTEDVEIITPNPATSGGAKWNIMAIYGSQIQAGKSEQEALDAVATVIEKTSVLDDSARDSLQTFASGKGDVLIGYENEAIQAQDEGIELEYVIPDSTLLIENPAAVTTEAQDPDAAKAFLDFIWTDEGQQIFADYGYRPVTESVLQQNTDKFPEVPGLFTIAEFGGWETVDSEFFDDESGKVTEILRQQGAPLE